MGHVVIAVIDGEMTVKRLSTGPAGVVLKAENPDYPDLRVVTAGNDGGCGYV